LGGDFLQNPKGLTLGSKHLWTILDESKGSIRLSFANFQLN